MDKKERNERIIALYNKDRKQRAIARRFGLSQGYVSKVISGNNYKSHCQLKP